MFYYPLMNIHLLEKRSDLAVTVLHELLKREPENRVTQWWYTLFLALDKQKSEALKMIEKIIEVDAEDVIGVTVLYLGYALQGKNELALIPMKEEIEKYCWNDPEIPGFIAGWYALLNEKDEALKWLERAISRGWINYPFFAEIDPFLENIRGEERFKKLMKRVKKEWENFEV